MVANKNSTGMCWENCSS